MSTDHIFFAWVGGLKIELDRLQLLSLTCNHRDRILVDISLANPSNAGYGWPLVKLFTFQSPDTVFLYMLRRSDDKIRDPMDAIVMPKKWHHWCVAIDGASNTVQGVSVRR